MLHLLIEDRAVNMRFLCTLILSSLACSSLFGASATWNVTGGGSWNTATNWNPVTFPNGIGQTATLGSAIVAPSTLNLNQNITVGILAIDNANAYTVAPNGSFTLSFSGGSPSLTVTNANGNGAHNVTAPIVLIAGPLDLSQGSTGTLTLSGAISEGFPQGISKSGTGTARLSGTAANTFTGATQVAGGVLELAKTAGVNAIAATSITVNGGTLRLINPNQIINTATITLTSVGTVDLNGQNEQISNLVFSNGTYSGGGGVLSLQSTGTALQILPGRNLNGDIALVGGSGGSVLLTGFLGTATLAGVDLGSVTRTFTTANAMLKLDVTGVVSGTGGINLSGAGTVQLLGAASNTLTGTITLSTGTLSLEKTSPAAATAGEVALNTGGTVVLSSTDDQTIGSFNYNGGTFTFPVGRTLNLTNSSGTALTLQAALNILQPLNLTGVGGGGIVQTFAGTNMLGNLNLGSSTRSITTAGTLDITGVISETASAGITKLGAATLRFSGGSANTYTGLTTVSAGTLDLQKTAGINAIAGDVTVAGGTLILVNANQIADTSTVTVNSGTFNLNSLSDTIGELDFNGGSVSNVATLTLASNTTALNMTFPGSVGGQVNLSGTGQILYSGAGTGTLINLDLGSATHNITTSAGTLDITGVISETASAGITKLGAATLRFSGGSANTYTGLTSVNAGMFELQKTAGLNAIAGNVTVGGGTLTLLNANQIADTSTVTVNSGTFNLNSLSETITELDFNGGSVSNVGTLTLASNATALNMTFPGSIGGQVNLSGTGQILYSGAGTGSLNNLGLGSSTRTINTSAGTLNITGMISETVSVGITKLGAAALRFSGTSPNTYTGLTSVNAGTLELQKTVGVNAIAGDVTIGGGTLTLLSANQIADTSTVTVNSGTFNLNSLSETITELDFNGGFVSNVGTLTLASNATALNMTFPGSIGGQVSLSGTGQILYSGAGTGTLNNLGLGSTTRTINTSAGTLDITGVISETTSAGITKLGAATLRFSGGSANTYTGLTSVNAGMLELQKTAGVNAIAGNVTLGGGTLMLVNANQIADTSTVTVNTGTFDLNSLSETISELDFNGGSVSNVATLTLASNTTALNMTFNGAIGGQVNLSGSGAVLFSGAGTGTLNNLDLGSATHNITTSSGTLDITGVISGMASGGITKLGAATLRYSGGSANTYTGLTSVNAGMLELQKTAGVNAIAGNVTVGGGTLTLINANQIADTSTVTVNTGTFDLNSLSETITELDFNGGSVSNVATLTLASNATALNMTFPGSIGGQVNLSGTGQILYSGAGTGTLNNLDLGSATHNITTSAGTLDITGVISETASAGITKNGAATLRFSGGSANTYTGLTTVSAGTLELQKTAGLNAIAGDVTVAGGTLMLVNANQIADTSTLTVNSGTFNLNSLSETASQLIFNGGAVSNVSVLNLANATGPALTMRSTTLGGQINLTGGAAGDVVFDPTNGGTATISSIDLGTPIRTFTIPAGGGGVDMVLLSSTSGAGGGFNKQGSGLLQLQGTHTYPAASSVTVSAGELQVNGMLSATTLQVLPGARLSGTGMITSDVTLDGFLSPGNSIGTIQLIGIQLFTSTSTLEIELNPSMADLVDIIGSLTIQAGATLSVMPDMGAYPAMFMYPIITTTGGITGTFTNVINTMPLFRSMIEVIGTDMFLINQVASFSSATTPGSNAAAVANALDSASPAPGSDLANVIANLQSIPTNQGLVDALTQLQPSMLKGLALTVENTQFLIGSTLTQRLNTLYAQRCLCPSCGGAWGSVTADYLNQAGLKGETGFRGPTFNLMGGVDLWTTPHLLVGLATGFSTSQLQWRDQRGNGNLYSGFGAAYARLLCRGLLIDGALIGGFNIYQGRRHLLFAEIDRIARSHFTGGLFSGHFEIGRPLCKWGVELTPYFAFHPLYLGGPSFTESGADSVDCHVDSSYYLVFREEGGVRFGRRWCHLFLSGQLAYAREDRPNGGRYDAQFTSIPYTNMAVHGLKPARNLFVPAAEIGYLCYNGALSVTFRYQAQVSGAFQDQSGTLQFSGRF
ncbi:MAG: autotransporter-associated beta strand repeat-containing protein [Parachlamydiales bacterium]